MLVFWKILRTYLMDDPRGYFVEDDYLAQFA